jgi:hypothetical protein
MLRARRSIFRINKSKAKLIRVLSITPGGSHAWCESDQGPVRKPIASVPKDLMSDYRNGR